MRVLKRINPVSAGKVVAIIYIVFGFVGGLFLAGVFLFGGEGELTGLERILFGLGAPLFLPVLYGAMGFVFTVIAVWIYNMIAKRIGGIEYEIEEKHSSSQDDDQS